MMSGKHAQDIETGTDTVTARIVERVAMVTLNRPQRRNALHPDMFETVPRLLEQFGDDDDIGCVMITGAGSAFCAGGDVQGFDGLSESSIEDQATELMRSARMVQVLHELPKVTIAALPGPAVGAGMAIALSADLRISARSARLIPGWGRLAFSGDFGGAWFLTRLVGPSKAMEMLLDGAPIDSAACLKLGLVNRVVGDDELADAALSWASEIAAGPALAWAGVKANIADAEDLPLQTALSRESVRMITCARSDDHRRAVQAWLNSRAGNKRSPSTA
jgi:2-(1,2-epoxy-1,2-dihydrophenyl)acetyl-CoA isomerase